MIEKIKQALIGMNYVDLKVETLFDRAKITVELSSPETVISISTDTNHKIFSVQKAFSIGESYIDWEPRESEIIDRIVQCLLT